MKKLTILAASVLVGFGLVSCDGDKTSDTDTKEKDTPAKTGDPAKPGENMETVSLKVDGMT